MKKLFSLRILFTFSICFLNNRSTFAQTLTCQRSCPQAGEVFSMRTSSPVLNSSGTNQLWNFAVIQSISPTPFFVSYNMATSAPNASLYPRADLIRTGGQANDFISTDNSGVRGVYPITTTANVNPMQLPLPFAYGDHYNETSTSTFVIGTDTFVTTIQNAFFAHGSGTLILPSGTFPDVLAVVLNISRSIKKNGSLYNKDSDFCVYYYSQNISHHLLFTKQHSDDSNADYGPYTEFMDQVTTGLKDENRNESDEIIIFPNPATDLVNVKFAAIKKGTIVLKNSLGQHVFEQNNVEGSCHINLSDLPEGMYIISFVSGTYALNRKLVVRK